MLGLLLTNEPLVQSRAFIHMSQEYHQSKALEKLSSSRYSLLKTLKSILGLSRLPRSKLRGLNPRPSCCYCASLALAYHIEDEHHVTFGCSGYANAREHFGYLHSGHITTVIHLLNQPQRNGLTKILTWISLLRMSKA